MQSLFPCICSGDVKKAEQFYVSLFGFNSVFSVDWYVQLQSPEDENLQLAFVKHDHPSVPEGYSSVPRGTIVTIETQDVDTLHQKAAKAGHRMVVNLRNEVWGQRHFMIEDPNGVLVDVVKMIEPDPAFLKESGLAG